MIKRPDNFLNYPVETPVYSTYEKDFSLLGSSAPEVLSTN
jgi:hypothetical protein